MIDTALTKQHFSAKVYRYYFMYLAEHFPRIDVRALCAEAGLPYEHLLDENNWVSTIFDERFTRLFIEKTGRPDACFEVGKIVATRAGMGHVTYLFFRYGFSVDFIYRQFPRIGSLITRVTQYELVSSRPGACTFRFSARRPDSLTPEERAALLRNYEHILRNNLGHMENWPVLHGLRPATIELSKSSDGTEFPVYEVRIFYSARQSVFLKVRRAVTTGLALGIAAVSGQSIARWLGASQSHANHFGAYFLLFGVLARGWMRLHEVSRSLNRAMEDYELLDKRYEALGRYRRIVDEMTLGLLVIQRNEKGAWQGESALSNLAFARLARAATEVSSEFSLFDTLIRSHDDTLRAVLADRKPRELPMLSVVRDDRRPLHLAIHTFPVDDDLVGILIDDVSNKMLAEEALEEQRARTTQGAKLAALGEMAGNLSHELSNPLAIISGYAQQIVSAMERGSLDPQRIVAFGTKVEQTTERMAKIIRGVRSFARDGSQDPMQEIALQKVLDDTLEFCRARFRNASVELRITGFTPDAVILGRDVQLTQILMNLLNNAFDAVEDAQEKWVHISLETTDESYLLGVENSGPAIPEAIRPRLFRPFFTTKPVGRGTGLGLGISRGIAESHGGRLYLHESMAHTRFVLELPKVALSQVA